MMERLLKKEERFRRAMPFIAVVYALAAIAVAVIGVIHESAYEYTLALSTLTLIPALWILRRLTRWKGGWQAEAYVYGFSFLGWLLGGAAEFYSLVPYFDKLVHTLSGVFVSLLAAILYRFLERDRPRPEKKTATEPVFIFFGSMAVAGLFELVEFVLSAATGRDMQHVLDSGVTDTIGDMFVCMLGTLAALLVMSCSRRGRHDPLTDAADGVFCRYEPQKPEPDES